MYRPIEIFSKTDLEEVVSKERMKVFSGGFVDFMELGKERKGR